MRFIYCHSCLTSVHEVIVIYGIHVAFGGILVYGTYLAIICEVAVEDFCFFYLYVR